jgi:hypothetical protein
VIDVLRWTQARQRRMPLAVLDMCHPPPPPLPRKRKASAGLRPPWADRTLRFGDWVVLGTAFKLSTPNVATARLHGAGILRVSKRTWLL